MKYLYNHFSQPQRNKGLNLAKNKYIKKKKIRSADYLSKRRQGSTVF